MEQWNRIELLPNPEREVIALEIGMSSNWGCEVVWQDSGMLPQRKCSIVLVNMVCGKDWSG